MAQFTLAGLDVGNGGIKTKTAHNTDFFPHALFKMTRTQIEDYESGVADENVYIINDEYFSVGSLATRQGSGAVLYGEKRYTPQYYGVLGAIGLFRTLPKDGGRYKLCVSATHTPKDRIYRDDLTDAIRREWIVRWQNQTLKFKVEKVLCMPEPVAHYRHATLLDGGQAPRSSMDVLRNGTCSVIDIGNFTTGFAAAEGGIVDYTAGKSEDRGVQDSVNDLAAALRSNYRQQLKGANFLDQQKLREALITGAFDARGKGILQCPRERDEACNLILSDVSMFFDNYGGATAFDTVLIAGGGGALLWDKLKYTLNHPNMYTSDRDHGMMMYGAAIGAYKTLQALEAKGKL